MTPHTHTGLCFSPPRFTDLPFLGMFFHADFPVFPQCYRDLALVSRDGMNIVLNKINHILMEKYLKLQDTCRTQVRLC